MLDANTDANAHVTACGRSALVWVWWESMSVWVTNWVWMRTSSDCCIVVLSARSAVIILEQQNAHEEIIVSPWPKFALIEACFKEKARDTVSSLCVHLMYWHEDSMSPQLSLDLYYTEDEIYELSYAREPKNCRAPVSDEHSLYQ